MNESEKDPIKIASLEFERIIDSKNSFYFLKWCDLISISLFNPITVSILDQYSDNISNSFDNFQRRYREANFLEKQAFKYEFIKNWVFKYYNELAKEYLYENEFKLKI